MNTTPFMQKLLAKQRELEDEIARLKIGAQSNEADEVRDYTDTAETDEETSDALDEATVLTRTLEDVRAALQRIEEGTYGKCVACGKPIEPARLAAVPWTLYCLKDEEKREARTSSAGGSTL
jgi:DnaK suppressor protein